MNDDITEAQAEEIGRQVSGMVDTSFAGRRLVDWSDPTRPATFSDEVMDRAYEACEALSPNERGALVVLAWGQNPFEHNNILGRLVGGVSQEQFEHAVAALILLWHAKATEIGV